MSSKHIFVIETCENCKSHQWNTRHDETKYIGFFDNCKSPPHSNNYIVSSAIAERIPGAICMRNKIPVEYVDYELYCNLVPGNADAAFYA